MLVNLVFVNNAILPRFFFFFLIIDLYFLVPATMAKYFNPIAELVIVIGMPSKEAKAEIKIHPVFAKAKIGKCLI